jgi:hypothetical protein
MLRAQATVHQPRFTCVAVRRTAVGARGHTRRVTSERSDRDHEQPALPRAARIGSVTGRRAHGGTRGEPAIDNLSLAMDDGTAQDFGPPGRGAPGTLEFISAIESGGFQRDATQCCPICIDGDPTDREHVPQRNLGGYVMTMTCKACNNGLGSRVEAALQDWFDHAYRSVAFEHDDIRGPRRVPTLYHRQAADGTFALVFDGNPTPEVRQMLAAGGKEFKMHYRPPDPRRYALALLKHAYLAACLYLKSVPDTEDARAIRSELVAARDTPAKIRPAESQVAKRLTVYRSHVGKQGAPLALVARVGDGNAEPEVLISLAGVLFVSWPFSDLPAGKWQVVEDG